ncbi:formaldehyde-activating enzyme [Streptomyces sp. NPDC060064]|uniref:formaldehyde-activating enzyme n=1 Tax=Streptomyces sp. NPDC060064 TaxID=3347049 RepID=UPI003684E8D1
MSLHQANVHSTRPQVGVCDVGVSPHTAHVTTVLGDLHGLAGRAWAMALSRPSEGHDCSLLTLRPDLPVKPLGLLITRATIESRRHADMTWGAAQAGVAAGIADAVADGTIGQVTIDDIVAVVTIWVDWAASDERAVFLNHRKATLQAVHLGAAGYPEINEVIEARHQPYNARFDFAALTRPLSE